MFVSESKFRSAPWDFIPHILSNPPNKAALEALITKPEVEARLLVRLANKARVYGCEMDADGHVVAVPPHEAGLRGKIDINHVVALYRDYVIPLTKDVEVSKECLGCEAWRNPAAALRGQRTLLLTPRSTTSSTVSTACPRSRLTHGLPAASSKRKAGKRSGEQNASGSNRAIDRMQGISSGRARRERQAKREE
jgi:hypothetical protein